MAKKKAAPVTKAYVQSAIKSAMRKDAKQDAKADKGDAKMPRGKRGK